MTAPAKDSAKHGWSAAAAEQKAPEKKNPAVIWSNGKLIPWESATVHVSTHALHYGSSVFEGMRCYDTPKGPALFRATETCGGSSTRAECIGCRCSGSRS